MVVVNRETGKRAEPTVFDAVTGQVMNENGYCSAAGPLANDETRKRYRLAAPPSPSKRSPRKAVSSHV